MTDFSELFSFLNQDDTSLKKMTPKMRDIQSHLNKAIVVLASRSKLSPEALSELSKLAKRTSQALELTYQDSRLTWSWIKARLGEDPSFKFVRMAEDLLLNHDHERIKKCEGEHCETLFFDQSKNQSRRWCEMSHCGMLLKSKRYYERHRKKS